MTNRERRILRPRPLLEALEQAGVRYVVIGGTAAVIRGATHLTFDLDITPARDLANLGRLEAALVELGARPFGIPEDQLASFRLDAQTLPSGSTWKFLTQHGELGVVLDPDGTRGFEDLVRSASRTEVYGRSILVASLEDVIRSKEAAGRQRDRAVLPGLRRTLELERGRRSAG